MNDATDTRRQFSPVASCSVLDWLKEGKGYAIDDSLRDLAKATMQLNLAKEAFKLDPMINAKFNTVLS